MIEIKLKIAGVIVQIQSVFKLEKLTREEETAQGTHDVTRFLYKGRKKPDILIRVKIVPRLPQLSGNKIFVTTHFIEGGESWRMLKRGDDYIYKSLTVEEKKQVIVVNRSFDKALAYLLPKENKGRVFNPHDIIYDFLQVLLINYFALNKLGFFTHSVGIKCPDNHGLLFNGKSGAGKSSTAELWHTYTKAHVLNDDRIIVRKIKGKFFIYGAPWHGRFSDYRTSSADSAPLNKIFFIFHSPYNVARKVSPKHAFRMLYPATFPAFWDKECLQNIVAFCEDAVKSVPCYRFGFTNDERMIEYVKNHEG
jgi:hypothetical protein